MRADRHRRCDGGGNATQPCLSLSRFLLLVSLLSLSLVAGGRGGVYM